MNGHAALYRGAMTDLLASARSLAGTEGVPACPGWTVHDLVAHQLHQLQSLSDGSFPVRDARSALEADDARDRDAARRRQDQWIAEGVSSLAATTMREMCGRWMRLADTASPGLLGPLLPDVVVHLHDLDGVAAAAAHRDADYVLAALDFWARHAISSVERATGTELALEVRGDRFEGRSIGPRPAEVIVAATAFELLRTVTGRRSAQQARELSWSRPPGAELGHLSAYGWRARPLEE